MNNNQVFILKGSEVYKTELNKNASKNHMYDYPVGSAWYNGSQPLIAKPVKTLELHDPKIQFEMTFM